MMLRNHKKHRDEKISFSNSTDNNMIFTYLRVERK